MTRLLYFAWVREAIGRADEAVDQEFRSVAELLDALRARGGDYEAALRDPERLRFAVNGAMARLDTAIPPGAEVAIFPPVTGG